MFSQGMTHVGDDIRCDKVFGGGNYAWSDLAEYCTSTTGCAAATMAYNKVGYYYEFCLKSSAADLQPRPDFQCTGILVKV